MASQNQERKRSRGGPIAAAVLLVVLVLYPLSYGPAAWLLVHGYIGGENGGKAMEIIYTPLLFWLPNDGLTTRLFQWYVGLWVDDV